MESFFSRNRQTGIYNISAHLCRFSLPQTGKDAAETSPAGQWLWPRCWFIGRLALVNCLFLLLMSCPARALEENLGSYVFTDLETGKKVTVWYVRPADFSAETPIVMVLHGQRRNARSYRDAWKKYADQYGFYILVPEFSESLFPGNAYEQGNYFAISPLPAKKNNTYPLKNDPEEWSFHLPDKIFDDFVNKRKKSSQSTYYLYGHSAGAQFAHRMLEIIPGPKIKMAIAANAGWYTLPDNDESWPYGLKEAAIAPESLKNFLAFPLIILLGDKDVDSQHPDLRRTVRADRQGDNRKARGEYFYNFGYNLAVELGTPFGWRLQIVSGAGHSNREMAAAAAALIAKDLMDSFSAYR